MSFFKSFLRRPNHVLLATALIFKGITVVVVAQPVWWDQGAPPVINGQPGNNHGPANIGQAKWMVSEALRALEGVDPVGTGKVRDKLTLPQPNPAGGVFPPVLDLTIPASPSTGWLEVQKAPLLIGQLKAISAPFYSVMNLRQAAWLEGQLVTNLTKDQANANNPYPWTSATGDDSNRSIATIGQLKAVFALCFEHLAPGWDRDGDGLSNAEEALIGSNPDKADTDGDGLSDSEEVRLATDPTDAASDGLPDTWEQAHAGTFALYAPVTSATLERNQSTSIPLLLSNDTASPISYTLSVTANTAGVVYNVRDSVSGGVNYQWEEISGTGTRLTTVSDGDEAVEVVPITGFAFPFEGTGYTQIGVGSNGILTFEANNNPYNNEALPTDRQSGDFIAAFWDDLDPSDAGDVYWKQNTDRLIIQYEGVARFSAPGNYTFQIVLYSDGRIQVRYKSLTGQTDSCTVGVQDSAGIAMQAAHDQPYLADGMSIEFGLVPAEFFSVSKLSGIVPPHGVSAVWGQFHSRNLAVGTYQASLTVQPGGLAPIVIGPLLTVVDLLDADGDTLPDAWEIANGYNPNDTYDRYLDEDGDLLTLGFEFAQGTSDKVGNKDFDGDGWNDYWEFNSGTNPHHPDTDGDSVGDFAEDLDHDGLSNSAELNIHHTHPLFADTDHDGIKDGVEVAMGLDPKNGDDGQTDLDEDGLILAEELGMGTDPANPDSDGDGLWDGLEVDLGLDPLNPESYRPGTSDGNADMDGDGLSNLQEVAKGTNPKKKDTDGDGFPDNVDADPLNPNVGAPGTGGGNPPIPVVVKTWTIERTISPYDFDEYDNSGGHRGGNGSGTGTGKIHYTADWYEPDSSDTYDLKNPIPYPSLEGKLAAYAPFVDDHTGGQMLENVIAEARSRTIPNPPCYHASMDHNRVWVVASSPPTKPISSGYVRVEERTKDGTELAKKAKAIPRVIPAGMIKSPHYDAITVLEDTGTAGNVAHSEQTKVSLLRAVFITPAGDPVSQPVNSGDGKNEFTFNADAPSGILEIDLKADVVGIGSLPTDIQNRFTFDVDSVGSSTMQWDPGNPGGKPTITGDQLTATVRFTNLPNLNADFGLKMARVKFDGTVISEEDFEVFFPRNEKNHPGVGAGTTPNWFFYWLQLIPGHDVVYGGAGTGPSAEVKGMTEWNYTTAPNKTRITLYDAVTGKFKSYGVGEEFSGIDRFMGTMKHEAQHVVQIARADALLPTNGADSFRHGWSWNQGVHNHWKKGPDSQWGAAATDEDGDGTPDNARPVPPFEPGRGDDESLDDASYVSWPKTWALPVPNAAPHPIESEAVNVSDQSHDEHQSARDDWANPGKNHQTIDKYDD